MLTDLVLRGAPIRDVAARAAQVEALGFDAVGVTETNGNPFLAAAQAAQATSRVRVATAIALAFPRTPMDVAYTAWDLQALSGGRFALGLGSQVRAHVERRYGAVWSQPAARMREYVLALRAIWDAWESGGELDFRGEFYSHTLMPPNFRPPPTGHPRPPVLHRGRARADDRGRRRGRRRVPRSRLLHRGGPARGHPAGARARPRACWAHAAGTSRSRPRSSSRPRTRSGRHAAAASPSMDRRPAIATCSTTTASATLFEALHERSALGRLGRDAGAGRRRRARAVRGARGRSGGRRRRGAPRASGAWPTAWAS